MFTMKLGREGSSEPGPPGRRSGVCGLRQISSRPRRSSQVITLSKAKRFPRTASCRHAAIEFWTIGM